MHVAGLKRLALVAQMHGDGQLVDLHPEFKGCRVAALIGVAEDVGGGLRDRQPEGVGVLAGDAFTLELRAHPVTGGRALLEPAHKSPLLRHQALRAPPAVSVPVCGALRLLRKPSEWGSNRTEGHAFAGWRASDLCSTPASTSAAISSSAKPASRSSSSEWSPGRTGAWRRTEAGVRESAATSPCVRTRPQTGCCSSWM